MQQRLMWKKPESVYDGILVAAEYMRRFKNEQASDLRGMKTQAEIYAYVLSTKMWEQINSLSDSDFK